MFHHFLAAPEALEPTDAQIEKSLNPKHHSVSEVPCPICRAEGVLVPLAKFAGKARGFGVTLQAKVQKGV